MSRKDFQLFIGATWFIDRVAVDRFGAPLDLTNGSVEFRMADKDGLVITLLSPADVDIASGTGGGYTVRLAADDARQTDIAPGLLSYEIDAVTASGIVAVQNVGKVLLLKSLRAIYPSTPTPSTGSHLTLIGGGSLLLADAPSKLLLAS